VSLRDLYTNTIRTPAQPIDDSQIVIDRTPAAVKPSTLNDKQSEAWEGVESTFEPFQMTATNTTSSRVKRARLIASAPRAMAAMSGRQNTDFIDSLFDSTDGTPSIPVTTFADVGGCATQLEAIRELCTHLADPTDYTRLRVRPPCGLLLHGPPGCGKSLVARAVAGVSQDVLLHYLTFITQELRVPLIALAAPQLVAGVSGESETRIRQLFTVAKTHAPCIVFLDEIDAVCGKRDEAQKSMVSRIVAQLLHELDGLFLRDFINVFVFLYRITFSAHINRW
jgi:ribosome biogenesis ATPase